MGRDCSGIIRNRETFFASHPHKAYGQAEYHARGVTYFPARVCSKYNSLHPALQCETRGGCPLCWLFTWPRLRHNPRTSCVNKTNHTTTNSKKQSCQCCEVNNTFECCISSKRVHGYRYVHRNAEHHTSTTRTTQCQITNTSTRSQPRHLSTRNCARNNTAEFEQFGITAVDSDHICGANCSQRKEHNHA